MSNRRPIVWVARSIGLIMLSGIAAAQAQDRPMTQGAPQVERLISIDLADVGLAGSSTAGRVTVAPWTVAPDHTHTGRTSIIVMLQGGLTDVRGSARREYGPGDVIAVGEGVTHHAENHGAVPVVYVEINTTSR